MAQQQQQPQALKLKCVLLGRQYVGKTCLAMCLSGQNFNEHVSASACASHFFRKFVIDNTEVRMDLWDTAGQERYATIAPIYYRDAQMIAVIYDITDEESFLKAKQTVNMVQQQCPSKKQFMIVGSKCDMQVGRNVPTEQGQQYAQENGFLFNEVSSKMKINVDEAFIAFIKKTIENLPTQDAFEGLDEVNPQVIDKQQETEKNKKKCC